MRPPIHLVLIATAGLAVGASACVSDLEEKFASRQRAELDGGTDEPDEGCPAGTYAADGPCEPCEVGTYCPAGSVEPQPCVDGTWDDDADPLTPCQVWTNCRAGEFVMGAGSATRDRRCVDCETGRFSVDPNATECTPWTSCNPGRYTRVAGSADTDRVCSACAAGTFSDEPNLDECAAWHDCEPGSYVAQDGSASADRLCESCPEGSSSSTDNAAECTSFRSCEPGTYLEAAGTESNDVECSGCPSGSYSDSVDAPSCTTWNDCMPGQFVLEPGSATRDRVCEDCPEDTYSTGLNSGSCVAAGVCAPGSVTLAPATDTTPAECDDCVPGEYCAGGDAEAVACGPDEWDDDQDPRTPCVERTSCAPGQYVVAAGDTVTDRLCAPCPEGTFSSEPQAEACTPRQICPAGSYVAVPGTSIVDRACEPCGTGTFTSSEDQPSCLLWSVCAAPSFYVTTQPSQTRDRQCGQCTAPEATAVDNASACTLLVFQMSSGRVVMEAESFHSQTLNGSAHSWELTSDPLASGGACMKVNPDSNYTWPDGPTAQGYSPRLDFRVNFTTTGTFYIHLRGDPGSGGANSNSIFAGVDNAPGPSYEFDQQPASWSWRQQSFNVNSLGQHTVNVWPREDGFCLDKIVVSTSSTPPTGTGPAQSPQQ